MNIERAREWLRLDGTDNDEIIAGLLAAAPGYIETATGLNENEQFQQPLVELVTKFLLLLWYNPDGTDSAKLQQVVDNLLKSIARLK